MKLVEKLIPLSWFINTTSTSNVLCPFHDNTSSPAAKIYTDENGISRLFCFAESKTYSSYHYIKLILEKDPIEYIMIKKDLTKKQIHDIINSEAFEIEMQELDITIQETIENIWADSEGDLTTFIDNLYLHNEMED